MLTVKQIIKVARLMEQTSECDDSRRTSVIPPVWEILDHLGTVRDAVIAWTEAQAIAKYATEHGISSRDIGHWRAVLQAAAPMAERKPDDAKTSYMLRNTGGPRTPNANTLFPVELLLDQPCPEMIPFEDADEATETRKEK